MPTLRSAPERVCEGGNGGVCPSLALGMLPEDQRAFVREGAKGGGAYLVCALPPWPPRRESWGAPEKPTLHRGGGAPLRGCCAKERRGKGRQLCAPFPPSRPTTAGGNAPGHLRRTVEDPAALWRGRARMSAPRRGAAPPGMRRLWERL